MNEIKKINTDIYNNKWQELIDSLLQIDYKKRFDINQVIKYLEVELNIKGPIINKKNNIIINNNNNKIKGEIYVEKEEINKNIQIINSFEKSKKRRVLER